MDLIRLVDAYGGDFDVGMTKLAWVGLTSPHYTVGDLGTWFRGANRGSGSMWDDEELVRVKREPWRSGGSARRAEPGHEGGSA